MSAAPSVKPITKILPVKHAAPTVTLNLHEHCADGSVIPIEVSIPPTTLTYRADGSVERVSVFLPICSYCASRITGVRVEPKPQQKKPNRLVRFGKWVLGVK